MTVILASGSPRRATLLRLLIDDFQVIRTDADESWPGGEPGLAVEELAQRKAAAVNRGGGPVVLAADTVGVLDEEVLLQPDDEEAAGRMLRGMQGRRHQVLTGLCVRAGRGFETAHVATDVDCAVIPPQVIDDYVESGNWRGKAGGYGIQDSVLSPFLSIEGAWTNVVGLPLQATRRLLSNAGVACRPAPDEAQLCHQNPFE